MCGLVSTLGSIDQDRLDLLLNNLDLARKKESAEYARKMEDFRKLERELLGSMLPRTGATVTPGEV